jgi:hypothetical protein
MFGAVFAVSFSLDKTRAKPAPEGMFWPRLERKNLQLIFFETNAPNPPRLTKTHVWCVFEVSVSVDKTRAKPAPGAVLAMVEMKKLVVDFFAMNAPNPPCWTQNSCLVCFRSFGFGRQNSCETRPRVRSGHLWSEKTCS